MNYTFIILTLMVWARKLNRKRVQAMCRDSRRVTHDCVIIKVHAFFLWIFSQLLPYSSLFLVLSCCGDFLKWLSGVCSLCSLLLPVMTYRVLLLTGVSGWGYDHVKKTFAWLSGEKGHGRFRSYIGVKCRAWTCEEKENFCMNEWKIKGV